MALSRIGKQTIELESGVTVERKDDVLVVKGSKGTLEVPVGEEFELVKEGNTVSLSMKETRRPDRLKKFHGLYAALLKNAIIGVYQSKPILCSTLCGWAGTKHA